MNVLVLGATGGTGLEVVERALERGHSVTAFVRSRRALARFNGGVNIVEGNPLDRAELLQHIPGHDAVISALGPRDARSHEALVGPYARTLTQAMTESGVTRLIIVSVAFLFRNAVIPPAYPLGLMLFKHHVLDCADMENVVRESSLEWTIVRPPQLTDKPRAKKYRVRVGHLPLLGLTCSRANVADFMVRAMEDDAYSHDVVGVAD